MKKIVLLSLFIFNIFIIAAQKKELMGVLFEISDAAETKAQLFSLGKHNGFTYTISYDGVIVNNMPANFKYILNKWNDKLELVLSKPIVMKTEEYQVGKGTTEEFHLINGDIYIILTTNNKKTKEKEIYISEYSTSDFTLKKSKKVANYKTMKNRWPSQTFVFGGEENVDEFGILNQNIIDVIKGKIIYEYNVLIVDKELNVKYENKLVSESKYLSIFNFSISNNQIIFFEKDFDEENLEEKISVNVVNLDTKQQLRFQFDDSSIGNMNSFTFKLQNNILSVTGFFKTKIEKSNDDAGVFSQKYDITNGKLLNESKKSFDFEFITQNMTPKELKKAEKNEQKERDIDLYKILIISTFDDSDGSKFMIGERFNYYSQTIQGNEYTTTVNSYLYSDLVIVKMNQAGEFVLIEKFLKFVSASHPEQVSTLVYNRSDDPFFSIIYQEDESIKLAKINKIDATFQKVIVLNESDFGKYTPMFGRTVQIDSSKFDVPLDKVGNSKIMRITF